MLAQFRSRLYFLRGILSPLSAGSSKLAGIRISREVFTSWIRKFLKYRICCDNWLGSTFPPCYLLSNLLHQLLEGKSLLDKNVSGPFKGSRSLLSQQDIHRFNIVLPTACSSRTVSKFEIRFLKHQLDTCELLGNHGQRKISCQISAGGIVWEICSV